MSNKSALNALKRFANECIQCRICLDQCALLNDLDLTPGEIAEAVANEQVSDQILASIQRCSLCGLCGQDCLVNLQPSEMMAAAREFLIYAGKISTVDYEAMLVDQVWNTFTLYRDTFGIHYNDLITDSYDTLFFPGCTLNCYAPEITRAAHAWMKNQGMLVGFSDLCCGKPLFSIGLKERGDNLISHIHKMMNQAGAQQLVTACPNCYYQLKNTLKGIDVVSFYHLLRDAGVRLDGADKLTVHDSCPDRFGLAVGEDIRALLAGYPLLEMEHHGSNTICCGSGGIVSSVDPDLCTLRARTRMNEFQQVGADHCVTSCMACAHRLSRAAASGDVVHCLEMVFDMPVDYSQVHANILAMWQGEWGDYNLYRLSQVQRITSDEKVRDDIA